jgi:ABC-type dipeptide/oligopeptide/nickel transport system permease component
MPAYEKDDALSSVFMFIGIGDNLFSKYIRYCYNVIFHFDFGRSSLSGFNLAGVLLASTRITLKILFYGAGAMLAVGIPVGVYAAIRKNSLADMIINVIVLFFSSIPSYTIALMVALLFVLHLHILPMTAASTSPGVLFMPTLTITLGGIASISQIARASMLASLEQPYIMALRSKGLKEADVIFRHALKNALIPIISALGGVIAQLLTWTFVVEVFFNVRGLGANLLWAVMQRDHYHTLGCVVAMTVIITAVNTVSDMLYALVNPQIKARYTGANHTRRIKGGRNEIRGRTGASLKTAGQK